MQPGAVSPKPLRELRAQVGGTAAQFRLVDGDGNAIGHIIRPSLPFPGTDWREQKRLPLVWKEMHRRILPRLRKEAAPALGPVEVKVVLRHLPTAPRLLSAVLKPKARQ